MKFSVAVIALVATLLSTASAAPLEQRGLIEGITEPLAKGVQGMEGKGKGGAQGGAQGAGGAKGGQGKRHEGEGEMVSFVLLL